MRGYEGVYICVKSGYEAKIKQEENTLCFEVEELKVMYMLHVSLWHIESIVLWGHSVFYNVITLHMIWGDPRACTMGLF
ncbi:hypothetical protein MtrunA17_Chr1g0148161 [Medicago truncatula]|uniref:Uncharacterized protein n=1 Tax=Medicago truncatula TaxID=3880 RepID=A0A396JJ91_MEDTR|nr:hypothetical protein MtrunA17_Chr1g0148161 [Medicago truncatula]